MRFQVPCERSSDITSFVEQPVCSNFKIYTVLVIYFFNFDFLRFSKNQRCMYKGHSLLKFFMLCERTSEITSFVEQPVYSNFQIFSVLTLVFLFSFTTIHANCFCKSCLFLKFEVLGARSSDIATFMEHPVYINLKMYSVLILLYVFCFATFDP